MSSGTVWRLERNDRRIVFAAADAAGMYADSGTAAVGHHQTPAWKLVLPLRDDPVEVFTTERFEAPAVLVPPRAQNANRVANGYVGIFLDAHLIARHDSPIVLSSADKRRLLSALAIGTDLDAPPDLGALRDEVVQLHGLGPHPDPRIAAALADLDQADTLTDLAHSVGVSAPRLRNLVQAQVGVPLATLRRWRRLRSAITALPDGSVADAAAGAGFSDQAHLARTARHMIGRSPSSLLA